MERQRGRANEFLTVARWWRSEYPKTIDKIVNRWCKTLTLSQMRLSNIANSQNDLEQRLNLAHLFFITLGQNIGAAIFVIIGGVILNDSGPSISVSFLLAGSLAYLSTMTYAEMASNYPVAGAGFNYILAIFGELPAWIVGFSSTIGYICLGGSLARDWSTQLAQLCDRKSFVVSAGSVNLDIVAWGIILILTLPVALRTNYTSWINIVFKSAALIIIFAMLWTLFPYANADNLGGRSFFSHGSQGFFTSSAIIYYAFSGKDAGCSMAEEALNPEKNVPRAILDSAFLVFAIYMLMTLALSLGVPLNKIPESSLLFIQSPFKYALTSLGHPTMGVLSNVAALFAIGMVLLIQLLVTSRLFLAMARYHFLPAWLARVDQSTRTPWTLTLLFGFIKSMVALLVNPTHLRKVRNGCVLLEISVVAAALVWRRYHRPHLENSPHSWRNPGLRLVSIPIFSLTAGALFHYDAKTWLILFFSGSVALIASSFYLLPQVEHTRADYEINFAPLIGSAVIFGASFLLWQLGENDINAVVSLAGIVTGGLLLYAFYGVHVASRHDEAMCIYLQDLSVGNTNFPYNEVNDLLRCLTEDDKNRLREEYART